MLRKDFVLCKTINLLSKFMGPITAKANKPQQKLLCQATTGILFSGLLIVTDFGRRIHDDCSYIFY